MKEVSSEAESKYGEHSGQLSALTDIQIKLVKQIQTTNTNNPVTNSAILVDENTA